ncbi:MAG TPA: hypothetical protein VJV78_42490 [Polyangiales bacterium]|nr:hypothetical protein [Polyangiales bacterium]
MTKSAAITVTNSPRKQHALAPWQDQDWQRLWLATQEQERPWRSLALLPAGPGFSNETMLQIAVTLSHTGMTHLGGAIHVADGTRVRLADLIDFSAEVARCTQLNDLVLIALAAAQENVTSISIAQAADCALLCVSRGQMKTAHVKKTIAEIGSEHFLGSAMFRKARA